MKKILLTLSILLSINAYAVTYPEIYEVYDLKTNKILTAKSENEQHSIASLTKLMTAHVFFKYYKGDIDKCITYISEEDKDTIKNTKTRIYKNKAISCDNLMQLMLVVSDNYAASAMAGSIPEVTKQEFYTLMNQEANNLGMTNTYYKDSSGLSFENKSTATDLLKLIKTVMKNEKIKDFSSTYGMNLSNGDKKIEFKNSNKLIRDNLFSADLSKTGYISESGYNLIFVPKKECNSKKIALIIMGAQSSNLRTSFAQEILQKYGCEKN